MKRISILALALMMALSLLGCRSKNETKPTETTPPATQGATMPSMMPSIDPTIDTNIPDPTVDSNSNQPEDSMTEAVGENNSDDGTGTRARSGMR